MASVDTIVSTTVLIKPLQVTLTDELPCYSLSKRTRYTSPSQVGLRWNASGYHNTHDGSHRRRSLYAQLARSER